MRSSPAQVPSVPATFLLSDDKRTSIEFAVEHLARHAPRPVDEIALPAGSPYGEVRVDRDKCTMCMACVGACPASALVDGVDKPLLKFIERNCVQCGLCEATCPEDAICPFAAAAARSGRRARRGLLNETQPFHCVQLRQALRHPPDGRRDAGEARGPFHVRGEGTLRRLQMCGDCRVVDMMASKDEVSVFKLGAGFVSAQPVAVPATIAAPWRPRMRRAPTSTRSSRACCSPPRTPRCCAISRAPIRFPPKATRSWPWPGRDSWMPPR